MTGKPIERTPAAHDGPLLIGSLLECGVARAPRQEIVFADRRRLTHRELRERVGRLASALAGLGVRPGDTVGVMDWDTHRYLECFFAIPMMGAVLFTINVRLSPEQILHTIDHAEAAVILVDAAFLPMLEKKWARVDPGKKLVLLDDLGRVPDNPPFPSTASARRCSPRRTRARCFPCSTKTPVRRSSTPPAPPGCPRGSPAATGGSCCTRSPRTRP